MAMDLTIRTAVAHAHDGANHPHPHSAARPCAAPEVVAVVTWIGELLDPTLRDTYAQSRAKCSEWRPFPAAITDAPQLPGVYLLRGPTTKLIRYVGMAGERIGGGRAQGLRGRLTVYRSGKGAVSGFGEAALDRALADPKWVSSNLSTSAPLGRSARSSGPPLQSSPGARDQLGHHRRSAQPQGSWRTTS